MFGISEVNWSNIQTIEVKSYICGFCGDKVSSNKGYAIGQYSDGSGLREGGIYVCPSCKGPTFFVFSSQLQLPGPIIGSKVKNVPKELRDLYNESRNCISKGCNTSSVLLCRKILMHISVELGAKEGLRFVEYIEYLSNNGYIPPNGKKWVDYIRKRGNEANHEIVLMSLDDAKKLVTFVEMLLKFNYEFPSLVEDQDVSNMQE